MDYVVLSLIGLLVVTVAMFGYFICSGGVTFSLPTAFAGGKHPQLHWAAGTVFLDKDTHTGEFNWITKTLSTLSRNMHIRSTVVSNLSVCTEFYGHGVGRDQVIDVISVRVIDIQAVGVTYLLFTNIDCLYCELCYKNGPIDRSVVYTAMAQANLDAGLSINVDAVADAVQRHVGDISLESFDAEAAAHISVIQ